VYSLITLNIHYYLQLTGAKYYLLPIIFSFLLFPLTSDFI